MSVSTSAANKGLEDFILDPIGVALQATIGDEQTAYKDPEKQERFALFESRTIDIWEASQNADVFQRSYPISRRLPEGLFDPFHPHVPKGQRLALRLLLTRPVLGSNQYARIDDLRPVGDRQVNYLPFAASEMQRLIRQWDLNPEYVWMRLNSREVGNFYRKTSWNFDLSNPEAQRLGKWIYDINHRNTISFAAKAKNDAQQWSYISPSCFALLGESNTLPIIKGARFKSPLAGQPSRTTTHVVTIHSSGHLPCRTHC